MFGVCKAGRIGAGCEGWVLLLNSHLFCKSNKQTQITQPNRQQYQTYKQWGKKKQNKKQKQKNDSNSFMKEV
jgi:hypothetical protein